MDAQFYLDRLTRIDDQRPQRVNRQIVSASELPAGHNKKYLLAVRGKVRIWLAAGAAFIGDEDWVLAPRAHTRRREKRERTGQRQLPECFVCAVVDPERTSRARRGVRRTLFVRSHGTRREPALKARAF